MNPARIIPQPERAQTVQVVLMDHGGAGDSVQAIVATGNPL
jgi:hypothetical protein